MQFELLSIFEAVLKVPWPMQFEHLVMFSLQFWRFFGMTYAGEGRAGTVPIWLTLAGLPRTLSSQPATSAKTFLCSRTRGLRIYWANAGPPIMKSSVNNCNMIRKRSWIGPPIGVRPSDEQWKQFESGQGKNPTMIKHSLRVLRTHTKKEIPSWTRVRTSFFVCA